MEHSTWHKLLKEELPDHYFSKINQFMDQVYSQGTVYPPRDKVFNALLETPFEEVRVVILGQDPYHGPHQAQGLSFSVPDSLPAPPSLKNILKELEEDLGSRPFHDLTSWAEQGVLLLNACLTVPAGQANGHAGQVWEPFTDAVIKVLNQKDIVIMGTGEPLDNYNNFLKFIHILTDEHGLNISQRNVTVSTCGIVPKILELAEERLQITLALSLHGSTQEKRRKLMPVANKYELGEVLSACDTYFKKTGRRVTFEYSLVHEVNDTDEDAKELSELLAPRNCHLNLIPVNPVKERSFQRPSRKSALNFKNKLEKSGINVTIRREMGSDIDGACGQLRRRYEEETMNEN